METSIIQFQNFIIATRDSGYKSTASALAELVDNAIEAHATKVEIRIIKVDESENEQYEVYVVDNGKGMTENELNLALQFGGSSRFNSRSQLGRYGMGLPNSSLSQSRRVEVTTWKNKGAFISNYLDVDEVIDKKLTYLPKPKKSTECSLPIHSKSGTIVRWKKCDRLSFKYLKSLVKHIQFELGRIFRYAIWRGVEIKVCNEKVIAFDPLFIGEGVSLKGGVPYGKELHYEIKLPGNEKNISDVRVRFIELPVQDWAKLPNEEKRRNQITKCAGVTILRAEREIDYGWFFMGEKRKENYDDWWRCEISFSPDLDEVFGVTHTKQEIKQTEFMNNILVPDMEQTARALNNRVRLNFIDLKKTHPAVYSKQQLERTDVYLPALKKNGGVVTKMNASSKIKGLQYEIVTKELKDDIFFDVEEIQNCIVLTVNTAHLFYDKVFKALHERRINNVAGFIKVMEMLIFAAARSEFAFTGRKEGKIISDFKKEWSSQLKTFIS
ncbi:MAG: ATP-binding protein [Ginsengibacter sp.]